MAPVPVPDATAEQLDAEFSARFLPSAGALRCYRDEVAASGLIDHLERETTYFWATVQGTTSRGQRYNTGRVTGREGYDEGMRLYALLRELQPATVVETGVCNGVSTAFLLLALAENRRGHLYSVDLPEYADEEYDPAMFWAGKGGAVVPHGKGPGWMVPDRLRPSWTLMLGRSQDELPPLLERVRPIDVFMHDSEHSYECMSFEFEHSWGALREGGVLIADDVHANDAFADFARAQARGPIALGSKMALLAK